MRAECLWEANCLACCEWKFVCIIPLFMCVEAVGPCLSLAHKGFCSPLLDILMLICFLKGSQRNGVFYTASWSGRDILCLFETNHFEPSLSRYSRSYNSLTRDFLCVLLCFISLDRSKTLDYTILTTMTSLENSRTRLFPLFLESMIFLEAGRASTC